MPPSGAVAIVAVAEANAEVVDPEQQERHEVGQGHQRHVPVAGVAQLVRHHRLDLRRLQQVENALADDHAGVAGVVAVGERGRGAVVDQAH